MSTTNRTDVDVDVTALLERVASLERRLDGYEELRREVALLRAEVAKFTPAIEHLQSTVDKFQQDMGVLVRSIAGDEQTGAVGIRGRLKDIETGFVGWDKRLKTIEDGNETIKARMQGAAWAFGILAALGFSEVVGLGTLVRAVIGISTGGLP